MSSWCSGKVAYVDLTRGEICTESVDEMVFRRYLGGPGIGVKVLLEQMRPGVDPLGEDNILALVPGLLAGTGVPGTPRYTVCARSPLTGALGKSEAGGWWGPALKRAGWEALFIRGVARKPVYLHVTPGVIKIYDATELWGLPTGEVQHALRDRHGSSARVLQIGPGAENLVRFGCIVNELAHFNGRTGMGAVMGSKRLKAIVVSAPPGSLGVADRVRISEIAKWAARAVDSHPLARLLHDVGTPAGVASTNVLGALPTRHWSAGHFPEADAISGDRMKESILVSRKGCFACPIRCKRVVKVDHGELRVDPAYGGPEYETLVALGSNCGIGNLALLAKANELCNQYTIDTISTGMVISFAMRCYEEGIITRDDTGGLELVFGNEKVLIPLIEDIARRRGFGQVLAEGSKRAASLIGRGAERFVYCVKGQEIPMHDPRVKPGLGLQYALSSIGADHWVAQHDPLLSAEGAPGLLGVRPLGVLRAVPSEELSPEKVRLVYYTALMTSMYDGLGVCVFAAVSRGPLPLDQMLDAVNAATGWDVSLWELMKCGERIFNLERLFTAREGFSRVDDMLPDIFFTPIRGGPLSGKASLDRRLFEESLHLFYEMAGWDERGVPKRAKLSELDEIGGGVMAWYIRL